MYTHTMPVFMDKKVDILFTQDDDDIKLGLIQLQKSFYIKLMCILKLSFEHTRRDSTDGRAFALYPADSVSNPVVSMLPYGCLFPQTDPTYNE